MATTFFLFGVSRKPKGIFQSLLQVLLSSRRREGKDKVTPVLVRSPPRPACCSSSHYLTSRQQWLLARNLRGRCHRHRSPFLRPRPPALHRPRSRRWSRRWLQPLPPAPRRPLRRATSLPSSGLRSARPSRASLPASLSAGGPRQSSCRRRRWTGSSRACWTRLGGGRANLGGGRTRGRRSSIGGSRGCCSTW